MIKYYKPGNEDFSNNGDAVLMPETCTVHAVLNGDWELDMQHPIDDYDRWKKIEENGCLQVPSFNGEQIFRIKDRQKDDSGIAVIAEPIFLDARDDCFMVDTRPTNQAGQQALNIMCALNSKYSAESNISKKNTAYYENKNLIEAINGTDDNAFLKRWGGEILYDNYKIIVNSQIGENKGEELRYGKNITDNGISEEIDMRDVVTRIVPKAYNGYMLDGDQPWVDSPLIYKYPVIHYGVIEYSHVKLVDDVSDEDTDEDDIICQTMAELRRVLREQAELSFDEDDVDKPAVTLSVSLALLSGTEQYKEYKDVIQDLSLGDTVGLIHDKLEIETSARVTELTYDCLAKKVSEAVIGDYAYNYFDELTLAALKQ